MHSIEDHAAATEHGGINGKRAVESLDESRAGSDTRALNTRLSVCECARHARVPVRVREAS
eukprot:1379604-Rhodomonas_salina.3